MLYTKFGFFSAVIPEKMPEKVKSLETIRRTDRQTDNKQHMKRKDHMNLRFEKANKNYS